MNQEERNRIAKELAAVFAMFGRDATREMLSMMVENLSDLPAAEVLKSIKIYIQDPKNTHGPTVGKLRAIVQPPVNDEVLAIEASARAISAITSFGYSNAHDAEKFIGEIGWSAVKKMGGWYHFCQNQMGSAFQAQVRQICLTQIQLAKAGKLDEAPALPEAEMPKQLQSFQMKKLPSLGGLDE